MHAVITDKNMENPLKNSFQSKLGNLNIEGTKPDIFNEYAIYL